MTSATHESPSLVRAIYQGAAFSFSLPQTATLGELAEELAYFGRRFGGTPLYVDVLVGSPHAPMAGR